MKYKVCKDCKISKSIKDFYKSKSHSLGVMCYCKLCFNKRCTQRWINRKIKAIKYKGGLCKHCGLEFSTCNYVVFDFHHICPSEKDYDWTKLRLRSWKEIKQELDKCVLLCSNCHRLEHYKLSLSS